MGDDEGEVKLYTYEGARADGETTEVTAGEEPKVLTQTVTLLGERAGDGVATFPNGDTYTGSFASGLRSGLGAYTYAAPPPEEGEEPKPPVATYGGAFKAGEKSGVGVMEYASGHKYHGSFAAGKYEGHGTMYYPNGDIYSGGWSLGKKHDSGTYIYKETGAKLAGTWIKGVLASGTFTDKFGNAYTGVFAADATSAKFLPGGSFSLASSATTELPAPPTPTWQTQYGVFIHFTAKDAASAQATIAHCFGRYPEQLGAEAGNTRCELLGITTSAPTPPYRPLLPEDPCRVSLLELFDSKAEYDAHKATPELKASAKAMMAYGASGGTADFEALETPMYTLEKAGFGSGSNHVIMICCLAKDADAAKQLVGVAKEEVMANMVEPLFVRGTVLEPTADEPLKVRWTVQWATYEGVAAHKTFAHHKNAGPKMFPLIAMTWGGALEYHEAYHFAK